MKILEEIIHCENCKMHSVSFLKMLNADELATISEGKKCMTFKKGDSLFEEGHRPQGVFCIYQGKLKLYKLGSEGREHIIRFAKEGDIVGYRSLLSEETYTATAEAIENVSACFIPKSILFQVIKNNNELTMYLMKLVCHELGRTSRLLTNLAQKPVRERLAEVLLILEEYFGTDDQTFIKTTLTREDIANIIGTATESVIRILSDFKIDQIIDIQGRNIKILNHQKLANIAKINEVIS